MKNLVLRCGGSTRKFQAIDTSGRVETRKLARGIVERRLPQYVLRTYFSQKDEGPGRMDELMARENHDETAFAFDIS